MKRALALLLVTHVASADQPPQEVGIEQVVALYREHSARLVARRAAIDVTAADLVEARIYPNPTLGLSAIHTSVGTDTIGHTQLGLDLEIPILIGHQRARREQAALRRIDATRADVAADQATAERDIRARFVALQVAQRRTTIMVSAVDDAKAVREVVAGRSSAGASSPYALERIDLAIAALASRLDAARADELSLSSELASAVGLSGWQPHATGELGHAEPTSDIQAPPTIEPDHPELVTERAAGVAAHAEEARAHADGIPTPSLGVQLFSTTDPGAMVAGGGFAIPLPLFDRNQGAVARARAEQHLAQLELTARSVELANDLQRASHTLVARRDTLAKFQAATKDRLPKIRTMAEAAYRSGQGGIVELLDALDAITETKLRELELLASVVEAELAVRAASHGR